MDTLLAVTVSDAGLADETGRVGAWRLSVRRHDMADLLCEADRILSGPERARCAAMTARHAGDLRRAAWVIRRRAAAARTGVGAEALQFGAHRAPLQGGVHVSLSHTSGAVAVALAAHPVGIDIEPVACARDPLRLAARCFAPEEAAALRDMAPSARPRAFARLWTAKEAMLKATGVPLSAALADPHAIDRACVFDPAPGFVCAVTSATGQALPAART